MQCRAGLTQTKVKNLSRLQQLTKSKATERYHYCFQNNNNNNNNNNNDDDDNDDDDKNNNNDNNN